MCLYSFRQFEAALAADAAMVIYTALASMIRHNGSIFKSTLRDGSVFNSNNTEGIDCDAAQVQTWQHGYEIMKAMREVRAWKILLLAQVGDSLWP